MMDVNHLAKLLGDSAYVFLTLNCLWGVFCVLLYLRYAAHVPGRRLAWLTIAAFGLMLAVLVAAHPFAGEPRPLEVSS